MGRWSITHVMFIMTRYIPIAWIISEIYGEQHYFILEGNVLSGIPVTLGPQSEQTVFIPSTQYSNKSD